MSNTVKLPNSKHCFVCGLKNDHGLQLSFYQDGPGCVVSEYTVPDHFQGYPGVVHGGIVASLLDEVLGRVFMLDDPNRFMYTAKLTARYRQPVPTEQPLRIVGKIVKDRGRMAESRAELYGPDGKLLAEADGLMVSLTPDMINQETLDALGWKVYPDEEKTL